MSKPAFSPLWLALIPCLAGAAEDKKLEPVKFMGDIRLEYSTLHRDDRNGKDDVTDEFRTRIRAGFEFGLSDQWSARVRAAGRYTTQEGPTRFYVKPYAENSSATGLDNNQGTLDEANVTWKPNGVVQLTVGRMQTNFSLDDVMQKAIGRKDSPSTDVSWTDGVHLKLKQGDWSHSVIWQNNDDEGSTNAQRPPLDTRKSGDSWFYSFGSDKPGWGPFIQRAIDVWHMPDGLRVNGLANPATENYTAVIGRATLAWPLNDNGYEFRLGGEYGHAMDSQTKASARLGSSGDVDSDAFQLTANLMNFVPGHSLGLLYGEADAGWLISPELGPNSDILELRYQWKLDKHQSFEARVRHREELERLTTAVQTREDKDAFFRYTYKF